MFQHKSFQPVSFSIKSFKMATQDDSARSGYWRLYFTELQEESLRKEKALAETAKKVSEPESAVEVVKVKPKAKPVKKIKPVVEPVVEDIELLKFKLRPIYSAPQESLDLHQLLSISLHTDIWLATLHPVLVQQRRVIIQTKVAANDADFRLRLLLLAA